jgi:hypothetical protein
MGHEVTDLAPPPERFQDLHPDRALQRRFKYGLMRSPGAVAVHVAGLRRPVAHHGAKTAGRRLYPVLNVHQIALAPDVEVAPVGFDELVYVP